MAATPAIGNERSLTSSYLLFGARKPWTGSETKALELADLQVEYEESAGPLVDEAEEPQEFQLALQPYSARGETLEWGGGASECVKLVLLDSDDLRSERKPFPGIHPHTSDGVAPRAKGRARVSEVDVDLPNGERARAILIGDDPDVPWLRKSVDLDEQTWLALCLECGFRDRYAPGELNGFLEVIRLDGRIGVQRLDSFRRGENGVFLRMPPGQYQISWVSGAYTHWTIQANIAGSGRATQQR